MDKISTRSTDRLEACVFSQRFIVPLFNFFLKSSAEQTVQRYYRYMSFSGPMQFITKYVLFLFKTFFPNISDRLIGKHFLLTIVRLKNSNEIFGICHIDVPGKVGSDSQYGVLGIVILTPITGLGIGENLLRYSLEEGRKNGLRAVRLFVDIDNHRAISLYEKVGFKIMSNEQEGGLVRESNGEPPTLQMSIRL